MRLHNLRDNSQSFVLQLRFISSFEIRVTLSYCSWPSCSYPLRHSTGKVLGIYERTYKRLWLQRDVLIWSAIKFLSCSFKIGAITGEYASSNHRAEAPNPRNRGLHRRTKRSARIYRGGRGIVMWNDCDTAVQLPWHEESTSLRRAWNEDENGAARR